MHTARRPRRADAGRRGLGLVPRLVVAERHVGAPRGHALRHLGPDAPGAGDEHDAVFEVHGGYCTRGTRGPEARTVRRERRSSASPGLSRLAPSRITNLIGPVRKRELSPAQLLSLHIARPHHRRRHPAEPARRRPRPAARVSVLNAFFTSTSAVCVTGLVVVDTPNDLSLFGQVVLMLLIQAGGLGYMTISSLIMVAFGRRISIHERLTLADALNVTSMEGLLRFTWTVALLTFAFEGVGALIMGAAVRAGRRAGRRACGSACSTRCRRSTTPGSRSSATT